MDVIITLMCEASAEPFIGYLVSLGCSVAPLSTNRKKPCTTAENNAACLLALSISHPKLKTSLEMANDIGVLLNGRDIRWYSLIVRDGENITWCLGNVVFQKTNTTSAAAAPAPAKILN